MMGEATKKESKLNFCHIKVMVASANSWLFIFFSIYSFDLVCISLFFPWSPTPPCSGWLPVVSAPQFENLWVKVNGDLMKLHVDHCKLFTVTVPFNERCQRAKINASGKRYCSFKAVSYLNKRFCSLTKGRDFLTCHSRRAQGWNTLTSHQWDTWTEPLLNIISDTCAFPAMAS